MSMNQPPDRSQECDTGQNNTVIIHRRRCNRQRIREAEDYIEKDDKRERESIDKVSILAHPERALGHILAAGKEMAADCEGVGSRAQNDKGAYKIGEGRFAADGDGAKCSRHDACENSGFDGAREPFVNLGKEARERRGVVSG